MRIERDFSFDDPQARLAELLEDIVSFYTRFLVFASRDHAPVASALWVAHTHAFDAADNTPYMHVNSPDAESGKSLYLEVSEVLVARPWYVDTPTEATVYRKVDASAPTMLFDETDAVFADPDDRQGMRALLNAGFRRGRKVPRCIGQGTNIEVKDFNVFCAKALAGIGRLPHTLETRKIPIDMIRKTAEEHVERWRLREVGGEADKLRRRIEEWATEDVIAALAAARPKLPDVLTDRQQDIWEPLLAIADMAGEKWSQKAREAAVGIYGDDKELSEGALLLAHIRDAFGAEDKIRTRDLLDYLVGRDDGPWARYWSRALKDDNTRGPASALASKLRPHKIKSTKVKIEGESSQGYKRADFETAWKRYLPAPLPDGTDGTDGTSQVGVTREVPLVPSVPSPREIHGEDEAVAAAQERLDAELVEMKKEWGPS